ncbi:helix-turn-helix transcriptional regulator [Vibrio maritimus]|uniref:helix-turn-helix transcriptional regulator n=1 Tax=Vibrio maritimus TaxID=990268 RepID=UPI001F414E75|nr:hypothetical protein [Vibrio maritimus]
MHSKQKEVLSRLSICAYSFSRVFLTGKRIEIWSNEKAMVECMLERRYISDIYTPDLYTGNYKKKAFYLPSHLDQLPFEYRAKYDAQLSLLREEFDHSRPLNVVKKHEGHTDYHLFYVNTKVPSAVNLYLSNIEDIMAFTDVAEQSAQMEIARNHFQVVNPVKQALPVTKKPKQFSPIEIQLLNDISRGRLYKNNTVGISEDSAKVYIHRMKAKLGLRTKNELISHYTRHLMA